jgi:hypothetical protein
MYRASWKPGESNSSPFPRGQVSLAAATLNIGKPCLTAYPRWQAASTLKRFTTGSRQIFSLTQLQDLGLAN